MEARAKAWIRKAPGKNGGEKFGGESGIVINHFWILSKLGGGSF